MEYLLNKTQITLNKSKTNFSTNGQVLTEFAYIINVFTVENNKNTAQLIF